jgi:type VI secretion system ImpA/VasJ family protein
MALTAEQPAGPDLSFDPDFEAVALEVAKLERVDGDRPNWAMVESSAEQMLAERTKDYRLVVWCAVAKVNQRGWTGFAQALELYKSVVTSAWAAMHPPVKRLKARANLHEWFSEQLIPLLEAKPPQRGEEAQVRAASAALDALDAFLQASFEGSYPGSQRLSTILKRTVTNLPTEAIPVLRAPPAAGPGAPSGGPGAPQATGVPAAPSHNASQHWGDPNAALVHSKDMLLRTAEAILAVDPASASAYQARRLGLLLAFDPRPREVPARQRLLDAEKGGRWSELLGEAEAAILKCPAWLDAHRLAVEAMAKLGPRFNEARHVVQSEAAAIVVRHPTLLGERFEDGSSVADARTQDWLKLEVRGAAGASAMMSTEDEEAERRLAKVRQMSLEGRLSEAVALAIGIANRAGDARGRFRGYLVAGKTAMDAGKAQVARPLLEGLLEHVERHQLEVWEPGLCVTLYASLVRCLRVIGGSSREQELFDKLCRLDPAAAMGLDTDDGPTTSGDASSADS